MDLSEHTVLEASAPYEAMTKGVRKTLPLSALFRDRLNVRRKRSNEQSIQELASLIFSQGLLQNLIVLAETEGPELRATGRFGVVAGGRRLAALQLLAECGAIPEDFPVDALEVSQEDAIAVSTAENSGREALHGADLFEAMRAMREQGRSVDQIADAWGVDSRTVERRLKLSALSPRLLELYRNDHATLDQMIALTLADDHAAQEATWGPDEDGPSAYEIRQRLTTATVHSAHPWAKFVGVAAYESAGGRVTRDLFAESDEDVFLEDRPLLERLVRDKLQAHAAAITEQEHPAWVEVMPSFRYAERERFDYCRRTYGDPTPEQQARMDELEAIIEKEQECDDGSDEAYEKACTELQAIEDSLETLDPAERAISGHVVYVSDAGEVMVDRDRVRVADRKTLAATASAGADGSGSASGSQASQERPARAEHSERLLRQLSAHRSAAIRAELADNPDVALRVLTYQLAAGIFAERDYVARLDSPLEIRAESADLAQNGDDLAEGPALTRIAALRERLGELVPGTRAALLSWVLAADMPVVTDLLAFCVASSFNGVYGKASPRPVADCIALALKLDMADYWQATRASYLDAVPKAKILEAVTEARSAQDAAPMAAMKKDALAQAAALALDGSRWLPQPLRTPEAPQS